MMHEMMKASAPDLTTTSHWALVTTGLRIFVSGLRIFVSGLRIFVSGLLNAGTLKTRFHRDLQPSLACFTSTFPFSFASEAVW